MSWLLAAVIAVAVAGVLVLTVALALLMPQWRERRQSRAPVTLWRANVAPPVSAPAPVTARPARALPAPQTVNNYFFSATPEQMAEVVARQISDDRRES